jgi:hypothetical protein
VAERRGGFEALGCAEEESCFHGFIIGEESLARDVKCTLPGKHREGMAYIKSECCYSGV